MVGSPQRGAPRTTTKTNNHKKKGGAIGPPFLFPPVLRFDKLLHRWIWNQLQTLHPWVNLDTPVHPRQ
jgi:hypothetical protein